MDTLFCGILTIVLAALLIHGAAFAGGLTYGREKLKGTSKTTGDFNLANRFTLEVDGIATSGPRQTSGVDTSGESNLVNAGASVTFTVPASLISQHGPFTYQWQKNGVRIAGATGASYTIGRFKAGDAATYTVVATNADGSSTSATVVLAVGSTTSAPAFTVQPKSRSMPAGSSVTFTAAASGSPTPTYQWMKNGVSIPGATGASYLVSPVRPRDAGTYTVVATNAAGSATSSGAVLEVVGTPR